VYLLALVTLSTSCPAIAVRKDGVASLAYVPGFHALAASKAWMAGTSPAMTNERLYADVTSMESPTFTSMESR
jgi:hypothetical protein